MLWIKKKAGVIFLGESATLILPRRIGGKSYVLEDFALLPHRFNTMAGQGNGRADWRFLESELG